MVVNKENPASSATNALCQIHSLVAYISALVSYIRIQFASQ